MQEVDDAVIAYLQARAAFFEVAQRYEAILRGNDNIVGRIGEYLAILFLQAKGRSPAKAVSGSHKGHDLVEGDAQISVKILTSENVRGKGLRLTEPWTELIVISLDTGTLRYRLGYLTKAQFVAARQENRTFSAKPVVKKSMLGKKGLIGRYGVVTDHDFATHLRNRKGSGEDKVSTAEKDSETEATIIPVYRSQP